MEGLRCRVKGKGKGKRRGNGKGKERWEDIERDEEMNKTVEILLK